MEKPAGEDGKRKVVTPESKEDPPDMERPKTPETACQGKGKQGREAPTLTANKDYLSGLKMSKYMDPPIH